MVYYIDEGWFGAIHYLVSVLSLHRRPKDTPYLDDMNTCFLFDVAGSHI